jgi:hypothetical protein
MPTPEMIDPSLLGMGGGAPMGAPMGDPSMPLPVFDGPVGELPGVAAQMAARQAPLPLPQGLSNQIPAQASPEASNAKYGPNTNYIFEVQSNNTALIRMKNQDGTPGPVMQVVALKNK